MSTKGEKAFIKSVHQQRRRAEQRKRQQEMIAHEELEKDIKKINVRKSSTITDVLKIVLKVVDFLV